MNNQEELTIEEIEAQVCQLLEKRDELIREQGVQERYFVWNTKYKDIDYNAWVLSSRSDVDKKILSELASSEYYPLGWRVYIQSWLAERAMAEVDLSKIEDV